MARGGRSGQGRIFKVLGGAVDIHFSPSAPKYYDSGAVDIYISISMPNYCDEPHVDLGMYVNKVLSAWIKICVCHYARASIMALGGRDLDRF